MHHQNVPGLGMLMTFNHHLKVPNLLQDSRIIIIAARVSIGERNFTVSEHVWKIVYSAHLRGCSIEFKNANTIGAIDLIGAILTKSEAEQSALPWKEAPNGLDRTKVNRTNIVATTQTRPDAAHDGGRATKYTSSSLRCTLCY